ncbi:hypothetical protein ACS0TY_030072 [Phlomoides rotata]
MVEIQKYLDEHPQYNDDGVSLSKFSFQIPKPLQENYVRKRPVRAALPNDAGKKFPASTFRRKWLSCFELK